MSITRDKEILTFKTTFININFFDKNILTPDQIKFREHRRTSTLVIGLHHLPLVASIGRGLHPPQTRGPNRGSSVHKRVQLKITAAIYLIFSYPVKYAFLLVYAIILINIR